MFHRPKDSEQETKQQDASLAQTKPQEQPRADAPKQDSAAQVSQPDAPQSSDKPVTKTTEEKTMNNPQSEQQENKDNNSRGTDMPAGMPFKTAPQMQPQHRSPAYNATPSASGGDAGDRRLVISQGITMSGEIEACDHLVIEGSVEAALKGARTLEVAESGVFYGAVEIEEATIAGRFEGDITVNGRLTIEGTGTITGTIAYKELQVEAGATIDGKISPLSGKAGASQPAPQQRETKSAAPRNDNQSEEREELPFGGQAAAAAE